MQQMVTPFANVATKFGGILPATRRDTSVFGGYCVAIRLLRMTKPYDSRLVSPQKRPVSRPWLKRQQPLVRHPIFCRKIVGFLCNCLCHSSISDKWLKDYSVFIRYVANALKALGGERARVNDYLPYLS